MALDDIPPAAHPAIEWHQLLGYCSFTANKAGLSVLVEKKLTSWRHAKEYASRIQAKDAAACTAYETALECLDQIVSSNQSEARSCQEQELESLALQFCKNTEQLLQHQPESSHVWIGLAIAALLAAAGDIDKSTNPTKRYPSGPCCVAVIQALQAAVQSPAAEKTRPITQALQDASSDNNIVKPSRLWDQLIAAQGAVLQALTSCAKHTSGAPDINNNSTCDNLPHEGNAADGCASNAGCQQTYLQKAFMRLSPTWQLVLTDPVKAVKDAHAVLQDATNLQTLLVGSTQNMQDQNTLTGQSPAALLDNPGVPSRKKNPIPIFNRWRKQPATTTEEPSLSEVINSAGPLNELLARAKRDQEANIFKNQQMLGQMILASALVPGRQITTGTRQKFRSANALHRGDPATLACEPPTRPATTKGKRKNSKLKPQPKQKLPGHANSPAPAPQQQLTNSIPPGPQPSNIPQQHYASEHPMLAGGIVISPFDVSPAWPHIQQQAGLGAPLTASLPMPYASQLPAQNQPANMVGPSFSGVPTHPLNTINPTLMHQAGHSPNGRASIAGTATAQVLSTQPSGTNITSGSILSAAHTNSVSRGAVLNIDTGVSVQGVTPVTAAVQSPPQVAQAGKSLAKQSSGLVLLSDLLPSPTWQPPNQQGSCVSQSSNPRAASVSPQPAVRLSFSPQLATGVQQATSPQLPSIPQSSGGNAGVAAVAPESDGGGKPKVLRLPIPTLQKRGVSAQQSSPDLATGNASIAGNTDNGTAHGRPTAADATPAVPPLNQAQQPTAQSAGASPAMQTHQASLTASPPSTVLPPTSNPSKPQASQVPAATANTTSQPAVERQSAQESMPPAHKSVQMSHKSGAARDCDGGCSGNGCGSGSVADDGGQRQLPRKVAAEGHGTDVRAHQDKANGIAANSTTATPPGSSTPGPAAGALLGTQDAVSTPAGSARDGVAGPTQSPDAQLSTPYRSKLCSPFHKVPASSQPRPVAPPVDQAQGTKAAAASPSLDVSSLQAAAARAVMFLHALASQVQGNNPSQAVPLQSGMAAPSNDAQVSQIAATPAVRVEGLAAATGADVQPGMRRGRELYQLLQSNSKRDQLGKSKAGQPADMTGRAVKRARQDPNPATHTYPETQPTSEQGNGGSLLGHAQDANAAVAKATTSKSAPAGSQIDEAANDSDDSDGSLLAPPPKLPAEEERKNIALERYLKKSRSKKAPAVTQVKQGTPAAVTDATQAAEPPVPHAERQEPPGGASTVVQQPAAPSSAAVSAQEQPTAAPLLPSPTPPAALPDATQTDAVGQQVTPSLGVVIKQEPQDDVAARPMKAPSQLADGPSTLDADFGQPTAHPATSKSVATQEAATPSAGLPGHGMASNPLKQTQAVSPFAKAAVQIPGGKRSLSDAGLSGSAVKDAKRKSSSMVMPGRLTSTESVQAQPQATKAGVSSQKRLVASGASFTLPKQVPPQPILQQQQQQQQQQQRSSSLQHTLSAPNAQPPKAADLLNSLLAVPGLGSIVDEALQNARIRFADTKLARLVPGPDHPCPRQQYPTFVLWMAFKTTVQAFFGLMEATLASRPLPNDALHMLTRMLESASQLFAYDWPYEANCTADEVPAGFPTFHGDWLEAAHQLQHLINPTRSSTPVRERRHRFLRILFGLGLLKPALHPSAHPPTQTSYAIMQAAKSALQALPQCSVLRRVVRLALSNASRCFKQADTAENTAAAGHAQRYHRWRYPLHINWVALKLAILHFFYALEGPPLQDLQSAEVRQVLLFMRETAKERFTWRWPVFASHPLDSFSMPKGMPLSAEAWLAAAHQVQLLTESLNNWKSNSERAVSAFIHMLFGLGLHKPPA